MLIVSPRKLRMITDVRIDSGMETAIIRVLRQLPKNSKIINAVRRGGDQSLADYPADSVALHKDRLKSASGCILSSVWKCLGNTR